MKHTKNKMIKVVAEQLQQLLLEFIDEKTTLKLLNEIFEKKDLHNQIFKTFTQLSSIYW